MKFKKNKFRFSSITFITMLIIYFPAFTMINNSEQSIYIESDMQSLDMKGNIVTFTGNVIIKKSTIKINADKVITFFLKGKQDKGIIDGYGNPTTFYQIRDKNNITKGQALHIHYEPTKDLVILMGNAYLEHLDNKIASNKITFLVKEQKMQAFSEKGKRVIAVFRSSQLQSEK